jgi:hypothetical protein
MAALALAAPRSDPSISVRVYEATLSGETLRRTADGILIHVRSIRHRTIGESQRFERSMVDHMQRPVCDHALALAAHVGANENDL